MPIGSKHVREIARALWAALVIVGLTAYVAQAMGWPLMIPETKFPPIPNGQGMKFFYGRWQPDAPAQGEPVRFTRDGIEPENPRHGAARYRVLYEAANYVLIVERSDTPNVKYPTQFFILTLEVPEFMGHPQDYLVEHSCDYGTWGTAAAFDWPIGKLLATFKASLCFKHLNLSYPASIGWSSVRLRRLPDK